MKKVICGLLGMMVALCAVVMPTSASAQAQNNKKAIVVVGFGTTFDDARKNCVESVEKAIKKANPGVEVRQAFTSRIIIKRLKERGINYNTLEQTLENLKNEGYQDVTIQCTHLTMGEEFEYKVMAPYFQYEKAFKDLRIGRPLLALKGSDYTAMVAALKTQLPAGHVVFMGHGSPHRHNPAYAELQREFDKAGLPVTIGVVEESDHPNQEDVIKTLKEKNVKAVTLMPLMLVAGDHANNDMAGNEDDSWKNVLKKNGIEVKTYVHGLGENKAIQDLYVQHVKDAQAAK